MRDTLNLAELQSFIAADEKRQKRINFLSRIVFVFILVSTVVIATIFRKSPYILLACLFALMMLISFGIAGIISRKLQKQLEAQAKFHRFLDADSIITIIAPRAWCYPVFFLGFSSFICAILFYSLEQQVSTAFLLMSLTCFGFLLFRLVRNLLLLDSRGRKASIWGYGSELLLTVLPVALIFVSIFPLNPILAFLGGLAALLLLNQRSRNIILQYIIYQRVIKQWHKDTNADTALARLAIFKHYFPKHKLVLEAESIILINAKRFTEADKSWQTLGIALQHDDYGVWAHWLMIYALIKSKLNELETSIHAQAAGIEICPERYYYLGALVEIYLEHQLYPERALVLSREYIKHEAKAVSLATHAWALAANGEVEEAKQTLKQVQAMLNIGVSDYEKTHIQYCAGWVAYYAGEKERAKAAFDTVQKMPPLNMLNAHNAKVAIERLGLN